jgi:hypothetical protein
MGGITIYALRRKESHMPEHYFPELEQPTDIHDVLMTARFKVVPDQSPSIRRIIDRSLLSVVVLALQPEGGGFLTKEYLDRHHVTEDGLEAFLKLKGLGELRERYLPSLALVDARAEIRRRSKGGFEWVKILIHHKHFEVELIQNVLNAR